MTTQKNFAVEALRFIFMVMICIHHSHFLPQMHHGYVAVDFFFILSGVFLFRTYLKSNAPSLLEYNIKRIIRFIPEYTIALIVTAIIYFQLFHAAYMDGKILEIIKQFLNNLLFLCGSGIFSGGG